MAVRNDDEAPEAIHLQPVPRPNGVVFQPDGAADPPRQVNGHPDVTTSPHPPVTDRRTPQDIIRLWVLEKRVRAGWLWLALFIALGLLAAVFAVAFRKQDAKSFSTLKLNADKAIPTEYSGIGAAADASVWLPTLSPTASPDNRQRRFVYNSGGRICIRLNAGKSWNGEVQCIEGIKLAVDRPLTLLEWAGGRSVYYITSKNHLAGVDHSPGDNTWKPSLLNGEKVPTHHLSQLTAVTWFNGSSAWLYYQDSKGLLREFGIENYRDLHWRPGSDEPRDLCELGTGIGTARWMNGTEEILELFFQSTNGAIHQRLFADGVWISDSVEVESTAARGAVFKTSAIATTATADKIVLAYKDDNNILTIQTRAAVSNVTEYGAFSSPEKSIEEIGGGISAVGWLDAAKIVFVDQERVLELSSDNSTEMLGANWTTAAEIRF